MFAKIVKNCHGALVGRTHVKRCKCEETFLFSDFLFLWALVGLTYVKGTSVRKNKKRKEEGPGIRPRCTLVGLTMVKGTSVMKTQDELQCTGGKARGSPEPN